MDVSSVWEKPKWSRKRKILVSVLVTFVAAGIAIGVSYKLLSDSSIQLNKISPPFKSVVPGGLYSGDSANSYHGLSLDSTEIKNRFFSDGPTNLFGILQGLDDRISGINSRMAWATCWKDVPTEYTFTVWNQSLTFQFQCFDAWSEGDGFMEFGTDGNVMYLYERAGQEIVAAEVITDATSGEISTAHVWMSVGNENDPWYGMSYGVIEILADVPNNEFQMSVAGSGFGYCGAQLRTDGTLIYVVGSSDMGTTCTAQDIACVDASTLTDSAASCAGLMSFTLPALGRQQSYGSDVIGASNYPGGSDNVVVIDGTSGSSVFFGPTGQVSGVASF